MTCSVAPPAAVPLVVLLSVLATTAGCRHSNFTPEGGATADTAEPRTRAASNCLRPADAEVCSVRASLEDPEAYRRLDPSLVSLVKRFREEHPGDTDAGVEGRRCVQLAVKFNGPVDPLVVAGFNPLSHRTHPTEGFSIAAGPIALACLDQLAHVETITKTEASRPLFSE